MRDLYEVPDLALAWPKYGCCHQTMSETVGESLSMCVCLSLFVLHLSVIILLKLLFLFYQKMCFYLNNVHMDKFVWLKC